METDADTDDSHTDDAPADAPSGRRAALAEAAAAWRIALVAALALALLLATKDYVTSIVRGTPYPFLHIFRMAAPPALLWALAVPLVGVLARRVPMHGRRVGRAVLAHLALGALLVLGYDLACVAVMYPLGWFPFVEPLPRTIRLGFVYLLPTTLIYYSLTLAVYHALDYYRSLRAQQLRSARLRASLADARLAALRTQLQPHFLFNTLNMVSALVTEDPEGAERMLARLGALLRATLELDATHLVPLARELEVLELYLALQRARFEDRLAVDYAVDDGVRDALVPALVLQPLAENAIRHGLAPADRAGRLEVAAWREGDRLRLRVRDDGLGVPVGSLPREGIGLRNTRARLAQLYGARQSLTAGGIAGGGFVAELTFPFAQSEVPAAGPAEVRAGGPAPRQSAAAAAVVVR